MSIVPKPGGAGQSLSPVRQQVRQLVAQEKTPDSNTGFSCTSRPPLRLLVDWLAYTAPADLDLTDVLPGADRLDWIDLDHGGYGYPAARRCGHVTVYYGARPEMGQHVSISGQGCRELEAAGVLDETFIGGWPGLLRWIRGQDFKITRFDVALDDRSGVLSIPDLVELVKRRAFVSRWRVGSLISSWRGRGGAPAETIQFGRRSSGSCLRIYDKALEQAGRRVEVEPLSHWVRVELETKDNIASAVADLFERSNGACWSVAGVLRQYLDFKAASETDSNSRRWPTYPSWAAFLENVEKIAISLAPKARDLASVLAWLDRQCSPALALLVIAAGGDLADLEHLVSVGRRRLKPRHLALLPT